MRLASIGLALAVTLGGAPPVAPRYQVILRHGTVVDGSGLLPYRADVAIAEGRIARIGDLSGAAAAVDLDVRGLYVTPGFINIHSHPDAGALARAENMLTQGVTTEIINVDGSGEIDVGTQLARLAAPGLAVNLGAYIGFNSVWSHVVGPSDRRPAADDDARMRELIVRGMSAGAWGVSAGLDYKPAYFARTAEVVRVVAAAAPWRTNFTSHDRVVPETRYSSKAGILETLEIAGKAGLLGVVTHMKIAGRERGSAADVLAVLGNASPYAAADAYPYLAGATALGALIIPAWAQDGGRPALLQRLADAEVRARVVSETEQVLVDRFGGPEVVYLPGLGKGLPAIMAEMNASAGEAIVRLVQESNPGAILHFGLEADLRQILQHPDTAIACDCGATAATAVHPRNYGSYPRVLGRYVREHRLLTWQDAIRKMTALPAATIGLVDRGYLAAGMAADVTVFDPAVVIDHATYEQPAVPSDGIRHVFVNGVAALRDGKATGAQGGRVLARGSGMPSRPMTANGARRLSIKGRFGHAVIDADVTQGAGRRQANGHFKVALPDTGAAISVTGFGTLQLSGRWASFTAQAKMKPEGIERPVTVIVDTADPLAADGSAALIVEVEGARAFRLAVPPGAVVVAAGVK